MPSPCRLEDALPNLQASCQRPLLEPSDQIIVALDGMAPEQAMAFASAVPELRWVKVGLELFVAGGPAVVQQLRDQGKRVFLDLKFHDIPATMAGACRSAARLGAERGTHREHRAPVARVGGIQLTHVEAENREGVARHHRRVFAEISPVERIPQTIGRPQQRIVAAELQLADVLFSVEGQNGRGAKVCKARPNRLGCALTVERHVVEILRYERPIPNRPIGSIPPWRGHRRSSHQPKHPHRQTRP